MKIGVIGAGAVGAATVTALIRTFDAAADILVVDRDGPKAAGLAADTGYAAALVSGATVRAAGYEELAGARLVIITAGVNEKAGGATDRNDPRGRLVLVPQNAAAFAEIVPAVVAAAPEATLLVVTDPPDPLADLTRALAGHDRVVSTGTVIDSLRFRFHLARELDVATRDVDAYVLGEHGTSEVFCWSNATVGGTPVLDVFAASGRDPAEMRSHIESTVRFGNITIIDGIGASQHGIGAVVGRLAEAILTDEHAVLPVASFRADYGVTMALPSVLGAAGVVRTIAPKLDDGERELLDKSARVLREASRTALAYR
ncbi:lactate/malate family dehydrogenase [Pseudonocardia xinjiangensis]|uniref:Lactate dehydrogenase n=1 Tax=Pseudonocardia xinjiangensis TaxID=75289 RepID=A0ABX1RGP7_9PSEU|nr:lactate dehydrogenase [Pseudonocardia xinjiangensis]NMH79561.1 lactate dehydrogenase [Pseudonocardia xinjiangensis]